MKATQDFGRLRRRLRQQLEKSRHQSDALFDIIDARAWYERPIEERHRIIFYLGHLETFDWNMICGNSFELKSIHREFEQLFAFGIDPDNGNLPRDAVSDCRRAKARDYKVGIQALRQAA